MITSGVRRRLGLLVVPALALILSSCATSDQYSSGRLAKVSPSDLIDIKPDTIAVGVELDSRVPAAFNRTPDLLVGVMPVEHNAWEPIGARLQMRPINLAPPKPDVAAGNALRQWMEPVGGRVRLTYVLTDDSREELQRVQQKFATLLKQYPPGSGKPGSLRIRVDIYRMIEPDTRSAALSLENYLQLSIAEGPFSIWSGRVSDMR